MQHRARLARIAQRQPVVPSVRRHPAFGLQRIRQRACAAPAFFRLRSAVPGEVEGRGQISGHRAPPCADVGFGHAETGLQEADHGGVVEHLRVDPAAAAPGRDRQHRHAGAQSEPAAVQAGRIVRRGGAGTVPRVVVFAVQLDGGQAARRPVGGTGRRRGRRHVVEEAVVFVVGDEEHAAAPGLGVARQDVQHALGVGAALTRRRDFRMFGVGGGRDDPRHLRQRAPGDVAGQVVQRARGQAAIAQGGVGGAVRVLPAVLPEAGQRVVVIVVLHVLVDAPVHARVLQAFGIGGPGVAFAGGPQAVVGVDQRRAARQSRRIVGAGPQEQPVRIGAGVHRAVVGVAQCEGVGQRGLERHVRAVVGAHAQPALGGQPLVHAAVVPGALGVVPRMRRDVAHRRAAGVFRPQGIGTNPRRAVRLRQHVARGGGRGQRVGEAAHPGQRAEVMVEGTVFLHQDHHVAHVPQRAGLAVGGDFQRAGDRGKGGGGRFCFHGGAIPIR
ncbi:hypothetical protein D9M72_124000 [compost metagenome]